VSNLLCGNGEVINRTRRIPVEVDRIPRLRGIHPRDTVRDVVRIDGVIVDAAAQAKGVARPAHAAQRRQVTRPNIDDAEAVSSCASNEVEFSERTFLPSLEREFRRSHLTGRDAVGVRDSGGGIGLATKVVVNIDNTWCGSVTVLPGEVVSVTALLEIVRVVRIWVAIVRMAGARVMFTIYCGYFSRLSGVSTKSSCP